MPIDEPTPPPRLATPTDLDTIAEILAASHEHYIWEQWLLPGPGRYHSIERLMRLTARLVALPHGEVWLHGDASAAVWLPPESPTPDPGEARELATTFSAVFGDRAAALEEVDEAVREMCPPERHWTLGTMGTRPDRQRQGHGASVLAPMLQRLDDDGECASLDTSTEANVAFYERLGFHAVAFDDGLPHDAPPVWVMWRDPT